MNTIEERKILEGIAAGNSEVIKAFYKDNYHYFKSYILRNSGGDLDAEDVFQDAMIVLYKKLKSDTLEINVSIRTYFYAICKNIWRSRLRNKNKLIFDEEKVLMSDEVEMKITEDIENQERDHLYRKYFIKLSDTCKEVLNLVFLKKSMKEISDITGYSEGYTRKKKFECKNVLMEMIEKDPSYRELVSTSEKE